MSRWSRWTSFTLRVEEVVECGFVQPRQIARHFPDGAARFGRHFGNPGGLVVADLRHERGTPGQIPLHVALAPFASASPNHTTAREHAAGVGQQFDGLKQVWAMTGIMVLSSKLPDAPPKVIAASPPMTWSRPESPSRITGLTLPGMIEEPGCVGV
jgi:hypothetical protein